MMLEPKKKNILLLGMVLSDQLLPERGQEFRDRVRCIELQRLGFNICTVDDKHNDDYLFPGLHCNSINYRRDIAGIFLAYLMIQPCMHNRKEY
jgi:hypothetical protein